MVIDREPHMTHTKSRVPVTLPVQARSAHPTAEELEKLAFLHRRGVLSREEYEAKKEELYNW